MSDPMTVLEFWLQEIGPQGWYLGTAEIDARAREGFEDLCIAALGDGLDHWVESPAGALAFLLLTDQFPRNIWRGEARAFQCDGRALAAARKAIAAGWDLQVPEPERQFFYLPFEHSEDPADQALAVEYIGARLTGAGGAESLLHARVHAEIIRRFGRFPFRNEALGRESSDSERAFLAAGGYAALARELCAG